MSFEVQCTRSVSASLKILLVATFALYGLEGCGSQSQDPMAIGSVQQRVVASLTGTVFGGGTPLVNAQIEALTDGTSMVVASTVTDASGGYALLLDAGTYDLRITPPAGSEFAQQVVQDITMSGTSTRHDVVLIVMAATIGGRVRGYGGVAVANATILVDVPETGTEVARGATDANGDYQLNLASGSYRLAVFPPFPISDGTPNQAWDYPAELVG